jgi:membrane-anchored mycosin MYCP
MGVVWLAEDRTLGRHVAIKELRLPPDVAPRDRVMFETRILREARAAGRLSDPGVVTVYDVLHDDGDAYIVMELIEAPTLSDLVARTGPLPRDAVIQLGKQLLSALDAAHAAGVVHRDVKPSNIMVLPNGQVKLTDFGIAQSTEDTRVTATGEVVGSLAYIAPERLRGDDADARSDLWALGAVLFFAAEGYGPYERGTAAATLYAILHDTPEPTRCDGSLAAVIKGLLSDSPADRPSAADLASRLARDTQVLPTRGRGRLGAVLRRRTVVVPVVLVVVAAIAFFAVRPFDSSDGTADDAPPSSQAKHDYRPTGARQEQIANLVIPPPLTDTPPPHDTGKPDGAYQQQTQCVASANDGSTDVPPSWGQERFDFARLHDVATGRGQTVAVIDSGVNPHPLLGRRLTRGHDYVSPGDPRDCDGSGTERAGLIAAKASADPDDFQGVAPEANILAIRQGSANFVVGEGANRRPAGNLTTLAQAIVGAADAGADVIAITVTSCRVVAAGPITPAEKAVQQAVHYAVEKKDAVAVASAGNTEGCQGQNNGDPNRPTVVPTPAWFSDDVLTVAATTRSGTVADFSVRGPWVGVAAPGTEITSLDPASSGLTDHDITAEGQTRPIEGTGYAAAYVAGLAALVRQHFPDLDARQVTNRIENTAEHPDAVGGWNDQVGFGVVRPVEALTASVPGE